MMQRLVFGRRVIVALVLVLLLLAVLVPASQAAGPPASGKVYVVRPGDTVTGIAMRFQATPWAIAAANGLANPNFIRVGQRLIIPTGSAAYVLPKGFPPIAPGKANYSQVVSQYGPLIQKYRAQWPGAWHIVHRGETLSSIAVRYGSYPMVIAVANTLPNPNLIYAGQRLWIPRLK